RGAAEPPVRPGILACIVNFSGVPHLRYQVGLPLPGRWREVINTDAFGYGGSGVGNLGMIEAVPEPFHSQPASAVLAVPPLGVLWLVPDDSPGSQPGAQPHWRITPLGPVTPR